MTQSIFNDSLRPVPVFKAINIPRGRRQCPFLHMEMKVLLCCLIISGRVASNIFTLWLHDMRVSRSRALFRLHQECTGMILTIARCAGNYASVFMKSTGAGTLRLHRRSKEGMECRRAYLVDVYGIVTMNIAGEGGFIHPEQNSTGFVRTTIRSCRSGGRVPPGKA